MAKTEGRWVFSHCTACAEIPDGSDGWDPGVGCPGDGPGADGCEAVWVWLPSSDAALAAFHAKLEGKT
jgi:hypothetical protein